MGGAFCFGLLASRSEAGHFAKLIPDELERIIEDSVDARTVHRFNKFSAIGSNGHVELFREANKIGTGQSLQAIPA